MSQVFAGASLVEALSVIFILMSLLQNSRRLAGVSPSILPNTRFSGLLEGERPREPYPEGVLQEALITVD
jgi:hypothetical protein